MLYLFSLLSIAQSQNYFDRPGYYNAFVKAKDQVTVNLQNGSYDCVFIWSHIADNDAIINAFKGDQNRNFELNGETTAIVKGDKAIIQVSVQTTIHIWIIKTNLCNMYSLLYTTPHYITDSFTTKKDVDDLCIFFSNHNNNTQLSFSVDHPRAMQSISVYSDDSIENPYLKTDHLNSHPFYNHFFLHIKKSEKYNLEFEITGDEPKDTLCDHLPIHMITFEKEEEKEILEESIISCIVEEDKSLSILPYIFILLLIIAIIIGASVCYLKGYHKRLIAEFKGDIINDGPSKIDIDPNEILHIDEIDDMSAEETPKDQLKEEA